MNSSLPLPAVVANHSRPTNEYNLIALLSQTSGILSLVVWLFAQLPQILENYLNKSVSGVSPAFLACWISGDVTNLIGCLLTRALSFQICLAAYYCFIDFILSLQYWYYTKVYPYQRVHHNMLQSPNMRPVTSNGSDQRARALRLNRFEVSPVNYQSMDRRMSPSSNFRRSRKERRSFIQQVLSGSVISSTFKRAGAMPVDTTEVAEESFWESTKEFLASLAHYSAAVLSAVRHVFSDRSAIGTCSGWLSTCLYITSRCPQIRTNYRNKSTKGISPLLFLFAMVGNILYTVSIVCDLYLLRKYDNHMGDADFQSIFIAQLPFLVGSCGTVTFDAIILLQVWFYAPANRPSTPYSNKFVMEGPSHSGQEDGPQPTHFTKPDWYTNNFTTAESDDDSLYGRSEQASKRGDYRIDHQHYNPNETTSLLRGSSVASPPSHYISGSQTKYPSRVQPNRRMSASFTAMARSISNSFRRSPSIQSSIGSPDPQGTNLIPSLVGTYSSLSKKMMDESKVPFSPIDFLHNDFLHENRPKNGNSS